MTIDLVGCCAYSTIRTFGRVSTGEKGIQTIYTLTSNIRYYCCWGIQYDDWTNGRFIKSEKKARARKKKYFFFQYILKIDDDDFDCSCKNRQC